MTHDGAAALLSVWGYPAYLVLFLASALGSPLTEDLLLLIGGYLVGTRVFAWPVTLATAVVGVVAADSLLYWMGRKLRRHSLRRGFVRRVVRPGRLRVATRWFARFGDPLVFVARLAPGTRVVVFVSAGVRGVPYLRFLAYDLAASLIWVPALLLAGRELGEHIGGFHVVLGWIGGRVRWIVVAIGIWLVARHVWLTWGRRTALEETEP